MQFRRCADAVLLAACLLGQALAQDNAAANQPGGPQNEAPPAAPPAALPAKQYQRPFLIPMEGVIDGYLHFTMMKRIDEAIEGGADLIVVRIDSPGGLVEESRMIAHTLRDLNCETVAWIPERALSGAAMVSLGCDRIIMHPSARLGDVGVVELGPGGQMSNAEAKVVSEVVAIMRELANVHGRPPALAEAMVDNRVTVRRVRDKVNNRDWFLTQAEIDELRNPADWEIGTPLREAQDDRFLEVTGERAVEFQLAQGTARNLNELKQVLGLRGDPEELDATWVDKTVFILNQPWVTALLFLVGLVAMYVEFNMPGIGAGAIVSILCFTLFFWSHWAGGTANWLEILMFVLGVAFVLIEIFVIPGFGFAGILGGVMILASIFMASQRVIVPETAYDMRLLRNSALSLVLAGVGFIGVVAVLQKRIGTGRLFKNLVLVPPTAEELAGGGGGGLQPKLKNSADGDDAAAADSPPAASDWIGRRGKASTYLRPAGKVRFGNDTIQVVAADGEFIDAGRVVEVVRELGNVIEVKEVN